MQDALYSHPEFVAVYDRFNEGDDDLTGHAFQCLLTDYDMNTTLATIRAMLTPGGRLMFESRNPATRPWDKWTPTTSSRTVLNVSGAPFTALNQVLRVAGDLVSFQTHYQTGGRETLSESTLQFLSRLLIDQSLRANGDIEMTYFGGWDGKAFHDSSSEIIVIAIR